jgi:hypothetical protein
MNYELSDIETIEDRWIKNRKSTKTIKTQLKSISDKDVQPNVWFAVQDLLSRIDLFENAPVPEVDKSPRETMFGTLVFYGEDGYEGASVYP